MTNIYETMNAVLEARKVRSAWDKGVNEYVREFISFMEENEIKHFNNYAEFHRVMLNGDDDWNSYSWGGCSLIYDGDIAKRLCTPSELRKTDNGNRKPNSQEEWLDVQKRALVQALKITWDCYTAARLS